MMNTTSPYSLDIPEIPKEKYFWDWFKKELRWPFLLLGGPVACLCEGVASAADAVWQDIRWFVNQFNPATCEIDYVSRYGKSRGLTRHYKESDIQWRRRVCAAHAWHKLAGRMAGIPKIFEHYGYEGSVLFNRALEDEPALWAHFRIEFGGEYPVSDDDYEVIEWILSEVKPAKSILESMTIVLKPKATLFIGAAHMGGQVTTIAPYVEPLRESAAPQHIAIGWQNWTVTIIKNTP